MDEKWWKMLKMRDGCSHHLFIIRSYIYIRILIAYLKYIIHSKNKNIANSNLWYIFYEFLCVRMCSILKMKTYIMYDRYIASLFYPLDELPSLMLRRYSFIYMTLQNRNQIKLTKNPIISLESKLSALTLSLK